MFPGRRYECNRKKPSYIVNRCLGAKLAGSSGVTHSGEREGESQPVRGWKGQRIPRLRTLEGSLRRP